MTYLLDTNICIYIIKKKPIEVFEKFKEIAPGDIGISSITLAELQYGVTKSSSIQKNQDALNKFIVPLKVFSFDYNATFHYGNIRTYLQKSGIVIGSLDMLIAAHALSLSSILVTNNVKEFERVPDLEIENWTNIN
jgi:tRNA(fMet)-specific endonuclease VapC